MSKQRTKAGVEGTTSGGPWKESEAREMLREWKQSGLSGAAFARGRGIPESRLWYWSKRLREVPKSEQVSFVPVAVSAPGGRAQIEIEHAGVIVRVREELGPEQIGRLVRALSSGQGPC